MTDKDKIIKELKEALDSLGITNKYRLNLIRAIEYLQEEPVSKIWHDVEENPDENRDFAFVDYDGVMWSRYRIEDLCHDWQSYVNMTGMTKWAYTSDLIKL